jgi:DNA-binding GntR family transcriptional regulator
MRSADTSERVQEQLIEALRRGEFQLGERLPEARVARMLSVSRTPVREAMRRLVALGVLEQEPNQAPRVRRVTRQSLRDLYELRTELEGFAAERAAQTATPQQRADLLAAAEGFHCLLQELPPEPATLEPWVFERLIEVERHFHECLTQAANNDWLRRLLAQADLVSEVLLRLRLIGVGGLNRQRLAVSYQRHRRLGLLIQAGRPHTARRWHTRNMRRTKQRVLATLDQPRNDHNESVGSADASWLPIRSPKETT